MQRATDSLRWKFGYSHLLLYVWLPMPAARVRDTTAVIGMLFDFFLVRGGSSRGVDELGLLIGADSPTQAEQFKSESGSANRQIGTMLLPFFCVESSL